MPGLTAAEAYVIMQKAHQHGMAVVGVWVFELAEVAPRLPPAPFLPTPTLTGSPALQLVSNIKSSLSLSLQAYCDLLKAGGLIASITEEE